MLLALTYHDPEGRFIDPFLEALSDFRPSNLNGILIQTSHSMNGTRSKEMLDKFGQTNKGSIEIKIDNRPKWPNGNPNRLPEGYPYYTLSATTDFQQLFINLLQSSFLHRSPDHSVLYMDGDTFTMGMKLWPKEVFRFWQTSQQELNKEGVGVVGLERSKWSMDTYPPEQKITESVINGAYRRYAKIQCQDVTAGVLALNEDILEAWHNPGPDQEHNPRETNLQDIIFLTAKAIGQRVIGIEQPRLGAYETSYIRAGRRRPQNIHQATKLLASLPKTKKDNSPWQTRLDLMDRWLAHLSVHGMLYDPSDPTAGSTFLRNSEKLYMLTFLVGDASRQKTEEGKQRIFTQGLIEGKGLVGRNWLTELGLEETDLCLPNEGKIPSPSRLWQRPGSFRDRRERR